MRIMPIALKKYEPTFGRPSANPRIVSPFVPEPKPLELDTFTKMVIKNPIISFAKF